MRTEFDFYAYNVPTSGEFYHNEFTYRYKEDFRNVKRYKEYLDCGFNIVQVRGQNAFRGGEWQGSNAQKLCDTAYKAGCRKLLITDARFDAFIREENLVGEGKRFASTKELDECVKEYVKPYKDVKGFFGIQLLDEPQYKHLPAYGQMVRSLKRVLGDDIYLQCNLFPLDVQTTSITSDEKLRNCGLSDAQMKTDLIKKQAVYEKYVTDFLDATGLNYVLFDEYPFRREYIISGNTIPNYQIVAEICKERGLEFKAVLQSFAHMTYGVIRNRRINESDMYWQTNLALGFGCREFSFYTYMTKPDFVYKDGIGGEIDGAAFVNLDGSKTALYYYTKRIIKEIKAFAPVALKYDFVSSHIVTESGKTAKDFEQTLYLHKDEKCPLDVNIDKGIALVAVSKNKTGKLVMIENIGNVKDELFDYAPPSKITVDFAGKEKAFYYKGKQVQKKKDKFGKYVLPLSVGHAVFVELGD